MNRLLVVNDDPAMLKFVVQLLEHEGYTVYSACDSSRALLVLKYMKIDLLLLGGKIDEVDGINKLQEVYQRYNKLPLIILTEIESAPPSARTPPYVLKATNSETVLQAVCEALEWRKEHRANQQEIHAHFVKILHTSLTPFKKITWHIDASTEFTRPKNELLYLPTPEYRLLKILAKSMGTIIEYIPLTYAACGCLCDQQQAHEIISTHIHNLRPKLVHYLLEIEGIRGVGYRLVSTCENVG